MLRKIFKRIRRSESGQSATEYMLIIAVVVLGLVAAASYFIPKFRAGVETMGTNINERLNEMPCFEDPNNPGNCG